MNACEDSFVAITNKDRNATFELGLIKAYLLGDLGLINFHFKVMDQMPDRNNTAMTYAIFYDALLAMNSKIFKQCATSAVMAYYNMLLRAFSQMALMKAPKEQEIWTESANMRLVAERSQYFATFSPDDGGSTLCGDAALRAQLEYCKEKN